MASHVPTVAVAGCLFLPMRTLFWKIFAWFGAAQLLLALALYFVAVATQRGFDRGLIRSLGGGLAVRSRAAAIAYEYGGAGALREAWGVRGFKGPSSPQGGEGFGGVFPQGHPPSEAEPPLAQRENPAMQCEDGPPRDEPSGGPPSDGNGAPPPNNPDNGRDDGPEVRQRASFLVFRDNQPVVLAGPPLSPSARVAVLKAWGQGSGVESSGSLSFLARRIQTPSGGRYVAVTPVRIRIRGFSPLGDLLRPDGNTSLRFVVLGLLTGAFCWGLARYLSDPARKLSRATHQLASGDLGVRVAPSMGRRRDELADLGRDFDAMAARIEELVGNQRRLLSDISHELRSPLARLNVALELASDDVPPASRAYLARIGEESAELDALIGGLLSLQRLEARENQIERTPLDLAQLVSRVAGDVAFEAENLGQTVEVVRLDACEIEGNAELLRSALQNVARNALLHGAGKCIEIALEKTGDAALVSVRDFGAGVPEDLLERLFEPFYRVATARDRQSGGTGLGLSITRRAIEAHGGQVRAFNAQGGGLRVEIRLPIA